MAKRKSSNKIRKAAQVTTTRLSDSPLARMKRRGQLSVYELTAADEILAAHAMTMGLPVARDPDLGIPSPLRHDAADDQAARRSDLSRIYPLWRSDLRGTVELSVLERVLFHETDPRRIDEANKQRRGTARAHLIAALRHFAALRGNTPRGSRDWKLKPLTTERNAAA